MNLSNMTSFSVFCAFFTNLQTASVSASDADNLSAINYGLTNSDFFRLNGTMLMTTGVKSKKSSQKVEIIADDGQFSAQMTIIVKFISEPTKPEFDKAFKFRVKLLP